MIEKGTQESFVMDKETKVLEKLHDHTGSCGRAEI